MHLVDDKGNSISIEQIHGYIHNRNHEFTTQYAEKLHEFLDEIIAAHYNGNQEELNQLIHKADCYMLEVENEHL